MTHTDAYDRPMSADPGSIAATYFTAWEGKDFGTLRSFLADDTTFRGPLGAAHKGDECLTGLTGMAQMLTAIDIKKVFVDGAGALNWFELRTDKAWPDTDCELDVPAGRKDRPNPGHVRRARDRRREVIPR